MQSVPAIVAAAGIAANCFLQSLQMYLDYKKTKVQGHADKVYNCSQNCYCCVEEESKE